MLRTSFVLLLLLSIQSLAAKDLSQLYTDVNPSVVVLYTSEKTPIPNNRKGMASIDSLGSGVLISDEGLILTAAHVVQTAETVLVEFVSGGKIKASIISSLPGADMALIKLAHMPQSSVVSQLADSDKMAVGDQVFVIGAPYGIAHTLTVDYLSGRHQPRTLASGFAQGEFFQTDAAINQGNSGGPMFNMHGKVIGVVSHIRSHSGGSEGLGFAITSNSIKHMLLDRRPIWSGMESYYLGNELARVFNLPQPNGVLVQRVAHPSPASKLGLRGGQIIATIDEQSLIIGGDIVLSVQGIAISDDKSLRRISDEIHNMGENKQVKLVIMRGGKLMVLRGSL